MQEFVHGLDMQVPTLLLGDFNGSLEPALDYHSASGMRRAACPLLVHLLGPGAPWVDVHRLLMATPLPWTYQQLGSQGKLSASRIDLMLANHAALALVDSASICESVRDGGHSPVLVTLRAEAVTLEWRCPRPQLPPLLRLSAQELSHSAEWAALLQLWMSSASAQLAMNPSQSHTLESLSQALHEALQQLVSLAGGWIVRPPARRSAYDSDALRATRKRLRLLNQLDSQLRHCGSPSPGSWPRALVQLVGSLESCGLPLPRTTVPALAAAVDVELCTCRLEGQRLAREMRKQRHERWRDTVPSLWRDRPGVVYHWLQALGAPWGTAPILDEDGMQCTTVASVDMAVRRFWVDQVLRQHCDVDNSARWNAFLESAYGQCIPVVQWPTAVWTSDRVRLVLKRMREGAAQGMVGILLSVWKSLPEQWMAAVARLLSNIEELGRWPSEWLEAYVTMIPKSSGGTRPRDQRPITVLEVLYRIWSKGVVMEWAQVLHRDFLGPGAMGFRAQAGTLHLAQLLADVMVSQRRRRQELWLASFDLEKCYDSLPWWAVFGVMRHSGVRPQIVDCFQAFYAGLRRRFRYGQVDGGVWAATNGLAQGCPASPDLLNMLFEAFHRWALRQGYGVEVAGYRIPSASFADDLALVASSRAEMGQLVSAYLEWCALLGVRVTKVQVWTNVTGAEDFLVADRAIPISPTFKIVGVVLGQNEQMATKLHLQPRLERALCTTRRLRALDLPAGICGMLWKTAILPQALYGCEVRDVRPAQLHALVAMGKASHVCKPPLNLNSWRAAEVLMGPPLGESGLRDPVQEMRQRQLCWLQLVCNQPGLVGTVHRAVAAEADQLQEPSAALLAAMKAVGWKILRNQECLRSHRWPMVEVECSYPGVVVLSPVDSFPEEGAVYTDGSICGAGGAAAVQADTGQVARATLQAPRSSTQCELAALCLALQWGPTQVLTDSLTSLQLVRRWGSRPTAHILRCADRVEVRQLVHLAGSMEHPPLLEKVKAHDQRALALGHPKAVGNDEADRWARTAATEGGHAIWDPQAGKFGDPVLLIDSAGQVISDVPGSLAAALWTKALSRLAERSWLAMLYPADIPLAWELSCGIFRRPVSSGNKFVHLAPVATVKWIARVRAGCLATRDRLFRHQLVASPACLCCGAPLEDDVHALAGCSATGTADWLMVLQGAWQVAAAAAGVTCQLPPADWLLRHHLQLMAALVPVSLGNLLGVGCGEQARFLGRLHQALASATAERFRRRGALLAAAEGSGGSVPPLPASAPSTTSALPPERVLSPAALRQLEVERRQSAPAPKPKAAIPLAGKLRTQWLRNRLLQLLEEDTVVCSASAGSTSVVLLELFERVTGQAFHDSPGMGVVSRVRSIGKVLGNLMREGVLDPPLSSVKQANKKGEYLCWNRRPKVPTDVQAWRARMERREKQQGPVVCSRTRMADVDKDLAEWLPCHPCLQPVEAAQGESGMALLILWEVDHGQQFPSQGRADRASVLAGFTRRLRRRVAADEELKQWLVCVEKQCPLAPGLPESNHYRWSVRICQPKPEMPQGWYVEFVGRWRAYLEELARPSVATAVCEEVATSSSATGVPPAAGPERSGRQRERQGRRQGGGAEGQARKRQRRLPAADEAASCTAGHEEAPAAQPAARVRPREAEDQAGGPAKKRAADIRTWFRPAGARGSVAAQSSEQERPVPQEEPATGERTEELRELPRKPHGRAAAGPPT